MSGFPVGPEEIELEDAFPEMVQAAQRKAQWMKLVESCTEQDISLDQIAFEGTRLGSTAPLRQESLRKAGLEGVLHAEASAGTLLLVAPEEPEEGRMSRALDMFHCSRASVVSPDDYSDLLCSFARQSGEDFGMGLIQRIDFEAWTATILSTAVPPAPVRILRIGALRVDKQGREHGELRPWQV
jgi:polynucleotide 5'-kinase involved in rRNA processing